MNSKLAALTLYFTQRTNILKMMVSFIISSRLHRLFSSNFIAPSFTDISKNLDSEPWPLTLPKFSRDLGKLYFQEKLAEAMDLRSLELGTKIAIVSQVR